MSRRDDDDRPSPESLLQEAGQDDGRGRLKIFLGAYPGVGKTYGMLQAAQERRREGVDIVVGVVETHGRQETEAMVRGLEQIPRRRMPYRGRVLMEMDIEALLWRKPALAIVDELAHSNVPGSRHDKRWQDVAELLEAGIDVFTTLNIQHLESLNDVVQRISGIQVDETVPDNVLDLASEIELVDLPPDDLLQRLQEGKVYAAPQIEQARRNFFNKGNLTALRELAMRLASERIDGQLLDHMARHAVPGPWPTRDRVLICVDDTLVAKQLVRSTRRMAERQRVPWIAVHVTTASDYVTRHGTGERADEALRLAESLGAEVVTLYAESDVVGELLTYAHKRNVTRIVVGRQKRGGWRAWFKPDFARRLIEAAGDFEVVVVGAQKPRRPPRQLPAQPEARRVNWLDYLASTIIVAFAGLLSWPVYSVLPLPNVSLVFTLAVLIVAIRCGLWPSVYASVLGFLVYNFFYTVPYYTFTVFRQDELFTIVFFLVTSVLVGNLAARLRRQIRAMQVAVRRTNTLLEFSRKIAAAGSLDDVLWAAVYHVAATLDCRSLVLMPDTKGRIDIAAGYPPEDHLDFKDQSAAEWAWNNGRPAGRASDTLPSADWLFVPLKSKDATIGLLGVAFENRPRSLTLEQRKMLNALADQVAVAIERSQMAASIEEQRLISESEQLRSTLLSSISHDLRTPLVSIIGSATTLKTYRNQISERDQNELIRTILEQGERLSRFVENLLNMVRMSHGGLRLQRDWCDVSDIIGRAAANIGSERATGRVSFDLPEDLPSIRADPVLMEQVFINLLDNALKHSGEEGVVNVGARQTDAQLEITVSDDGPGIPAEKRDEVFEQFVRLGTTDGRPAGTGLGLSICRGIVVAHGGTIVAEAGPGGRGTTIRVCLPLDPAPDTDTGPLVPDDQEANAASVTQEVPSHG